MYFYSICFWLVAVIGVNQFVWNIPRILIPRNLFVLTTLFVVICRWELVKAAVVKLDKSSASLRESALRWSVLVQYWLKINVAPFVSVSEQSQSCCICFILFFLLQKVILVSLLQLCFAKTSFSFIFFCKYCAHISLSLLMFLQRIILLMTVFFPLISHSHVQFFVLDLPRRESISEKERNQGNQAWK